ncbi:DUF1854 domain-containing protein [Ideonella oryzae]|uniref:DUF1854 domain-containing protein n=1 Tax=Ideonella oryzae TaxID=2937441 RepID=A0ABT1BME6_9BURK|nr:DUF1854 domain-containing protein [Ideonella oryzae]MCO5977405.1 DUF1854 domain-containing protein [Ideonella oryzae]
MTSDLSVFELRRNALGRLVYTGADGVAHEGITPVRAFPLSAPDEGLSLVATTGQELAWLPRLSEVPQPARQLLEQELAGREFMPVIRRLLSVSTFSTPSTWTVDTDRGPATLVLKVEEDIRRLPQRGHLLITSGHGIVFLVPDLTALDRHSKRLLERFL